MNPRKPLEDTFSPQEVGAKLGLHKNVILEKIAAGEIGPVYRLNSRVIRIPLSTLNAYLHARTLQIAPTPSAQ